MNVYTIPGYLSVTGDETLTSESSSLLSRNEIEAEKRILKKLTSQRTSNMKTRTFLKEYNGLDV
jgi:hypothetical protein